MTTAAQPFSALEFATGAARVYHNEAHFLKHCEVAALLANREDDRDHPSVKFHIRNAVRSATNHVGFAPGNEKQSAEWMSCAAGQQMTAGRFENLVSEHVVPVSVLNDMLLQLARHETLTVGSVAKLLRTHTLRAVITLEEDKALRGLKLHKTMPPAATVHESHRARYRMAAIELEKNRYATLLRQARRGAVALDNDVGAAHELAPVVP